MRDSYTHTRPSTQARLLAWIVAALLIASPLLAHGVMAEGENDQTQVAEIQNGDQGQVSEIQNGDATSGKQQSIINDPAPTATSVPPTATAPPPTPTTAPVEPTATTPPTSPTATATSADGTVTPSPTATATIAPLPNTDSLTAIDPTSVTLKPGEQLQIAFRYHVTTPRTVTDIHAELRLADNTPATGWTLLAPTGTASNGVTVDLAEQTTVTPGADFTIAFTIQAPATIAADQTVVLLVSSTATTPSGEIETGIAPSDEPVAIVTAHVPGLAAAKMGEPKIMSSLTSSLKTVTTATTGGTVSCDTTVASEIAPDGDAVLFCSYTATGDSEGATVTAALTTTPGDGWTVEIGEATGDAVSWTGSTTWTASGPLKDGDTIALAVKMHAPADTTEGQQATVAITANGATDPAASWTVTVTSPLATGGFSAMSVVDPVPPSNLFCTQTSPIGTDAVDDGESVTFSCGADFLGTVQVTNAAFASLSDDWEYKVEGMSSFTTSPLDTTSGSLPSLLPLLNSGTRSFTVELHPTADATPGQPGTLDVTLTVNDGSGSAYTNTIGGTRSSANDAPGTCNLVDPADGVVEVDAYATYKCTHTNPFKIAGSGITSKWQWAYNYESNIVPGTTAWLSDDFTDDAGASGNIQTVYVYLRPNPADPPHPGTSGSLTVTLSKPNGNEVFIFTLTATLNTAPCAPTVSLTEVNGIALDFGSSTWNGTSYPSMNGTLNMNIAEDTRSGCSGLTDNWDVDMQINGLYQDGDTANGFHIPATNITWQSITPGGGGSSSDAPPLTLNGSALAGGSTSANALGSWNVNFQLQPPNTAPADDYSGTITVTIGTGS